MIKDSLSLKGLSKILTKYSRVTSNDLKRNLDAFQTSVLPCAEKLGVEMRLDVNKLKFNLLDLPSL